MQLPSGGTQEVFRSGELDFTYTPLYNTNANQIELRIFKTSFQYNFADTTVQPPFSALTLA